MTEITKDDRALAHKIASGYDVAHSKSLEHEIAEAVAQAYQRGLAASLGEPVYVIFDQAPGPEGATFVEVETEDGKGVGGIPWGHKPYPNYAPGFWRLGPLYRPTDKGENNDG